MLSFTGKTEIEARKQSELRAYKKRQVVNNNIRS